MIKTCNFDAVLTMNVVWIALKRADRSFENLHFVNEGEGSLSAGFYLDHLLHAVDEI